MAKYTITIELDNAAFEDGNEGAEVARILRALATRCEVCGEAREEAKLFDFNGNRVGMGEREE